MNLMVGVDFIAVGVRPGVRTACSAREAYSTIASSSRCLVCVRTLASDLEKGMALYLGCASQI